MRWLSLLAFFTFLAPTDAAASGCYTALFVHYEVPSGCPIVVYQHARQLPAAPVVYARRDGMLVELTGTVEQQATTLPVSYPETDCHENIVSVTTRDEPYDAYRIRVDTIVGEELNIGGLTVRVTPPATCIEPPAPEPVCGHLAPRCDDATQPSDELDGGGCSTSGRGAGLAFALLALALAVRPRR